MLYMYLFLLPGLTTRCVVNLAIKSCFPHPMQVAPVAKAGISSARAPEVVLELESTTGCFVHIFLFGGLGQTVYHSSQGDICLYFQE